MNYITVFFLSYSYIMNDITVFCCIIVLILLLILLLQKKYESYTNILTEETDPSVEELDRPDPLFEVGISSSKSNDRIYFQRTYKTPPFVFTQVISQKDIIDEEQIDYKNKSVIVNIYNVTTKGFHYKKNKVYNNIGNSFVVTQLKESNDEPFYWIAIEK